MQTQLFVNIVVVVVVFNILVLLCKYFLINCVLSIFDPVIRVSVFANLSSVLFERKCQSVTDGCYITLEFEDDGTSLY